jgi:hypothetical protein
MLFAKGHDGLEVRSTKDFEITGRIQRWTAFTYMEYH